MCRACLESRPDRLFCCRGDVVDFQTYLPPLLQWVHVGHADSMLVSMSLSKIFLLLLPLPLSTSSSQPLVEPLLVGLRPGSTLQPNSTLLLTCSLPSTPLPTNSKLNFTWSVDSRLRWRDPSPLHTQSHVASSWEYRPQTGGKFVSLEKLLFVLRRSEGRRS